MHMISFVSIIKLENGVASYKVVERTENDYTAYLVRNTSPQPLPEEVIIDAQKAQQAEDDGDPLVVKLVTAIKSSSLMDDDPA
jgi:hypothetical protein